MGIPQVKGQVTRAPALALRAIFAGIGRILVPADRLLSGAGQAAARAAANGGQPAARRQQRAGAAPLAPPGSRWRSLDQTGNVRLLSDEHADDDYDLMPAPGTSTTVSASAAAGDGSAPAARSRASRHALPLANYDELSLASIRARLRGLNVSQLRVLAEYEGRNGERPEVLGMFERRIAKLESGE